MLMYIYKINDNDEIVTLLHIENIVTKEPKYVK